MSCRSLARLAGELSLKALVKCNALKLMKFENMREWRWTSSPVLKEDKDSSLWSRMRSSTLATWWYAFPLISFIALLDISTSFKWGVWSWSPNTFHGKMGILLPVNIRDWKSNNEIKTKVLCYVLHNKLARITSVSRGKLCSSVVLVKPVFVQLTRNIFLAVLPHRHRPRKAGPHCNEDNSEVLTCT